MTRHSFLYLFSIILLLMSGCNGHSTPSESSTTKATAESEVPSVVREVPLSSMSTTGQSTLNATVSSATLSPTPSVQKKSDPIIGDSLKDHSFQVNFENFGESEFISTAEKANGKRPHFYFKKGDSVTELKYEPESPESFYSVSAVSFRDVSGDGKKDIIVIVDYTTGFGYMGAIPASQLIIFIQTKSGFIEDHSIEDRARSGVPYRILTIPDVMIGLKTDPKESVANAWQRLHLGTFMQEGSGELAGSTLTIKKASGDGLLFSLDAFYAPNEEALKQGGVNIGTIESGKATPSNADMIFKDGKYELSFYMISSTDLYVRDNGEPYFGHNVNVNGIYSPK